jgi:hypothetical protein
VRHTGKVINLMNALRKSLGSVRTRVPKKPVAGEKSLMRMGIGLVMPAKAATSRRKSAWRHIVWVFRDGPGNLGSCGAFAMDAARRSAGLRPNPLWMA